jgi:hypothetical protein
MPRHYQGVYFTRSFRRVSAATIRKVEQELGVVFPNDYRAFLLAINGGVPTPSQFQMAKPGRRGEQICIDFFYGVGATRRRLELLYQQKQIIGRTDTMPEGFVTIGFDPGAAPYFISTTGKRAGAIYFYDPSGFLDPGKSPKLYVAAKCFSDLLKRLAAGE